MASDAEIRDIELSRLAQLEKQAALFGPHTEPAILIEIQELRNRHGMATAPSYGRRRTDQMLDFDFLMNTVAQALQRITAVEVKQRASEVVRNAFYIITLVGQLLILWEISRLAARLGGF